MKNKGFTLVELIATLIVISVIALIAIPNISNSLKQIIFGITLTQAEGIVDSAKSWAADNLDKVPNENGVSVIVTLSELKENGYIDKNVYKNSDRTEYQNSVFVIIKCLVIESDEYNSENTKYEYRIIETNEKLLSYLAEIYALNNNITTKTVVTLNDLINLADSKLLENGKLKSIETNGTINSASVEINYVNNSYTYNVTINE